MKTLTIKRILIPVLSLALVVHITGCKKFIQIEISPELVATEQVFSDDKTALAAINGVYAQMRAASPTIMNGGTTIYAGLSADELFTPVSNANTDPFFLNALLPSMGIISGSFWRPAYQAIYKTNAIIENLSKTGPVTDSVRVQLLGEAKFIRAFYYFYLVNLFGDVPLPITTDYRANGTLPRAPVIEVYGQIAKDLMEARDLLKPSYPAPLKSRPNKWAATALLARVYLYTGDWQRAEDMATQVISSGMYTLAPISSVFASGSTETIWQILSEGSNTAEGATFIPSSSTIKPAYVVTDSLLSLFKDGDKRKANWLSFNLNGGKEYYYPWKYKSRTNTPVNEYLVALRLAEIYLVRAEARNHLDNLSGAKADLDVVRTRAGLPPVAADDKDSLALAIEKERQVELFAEWGHRWFDLKRTGRVDEVLSLAKGTNWKSTAALFPIPQSELLIDVYLTQNPGY